MSRHYRDKRYGGRDRRRDRYDDDRDRRSRRDRYDDRDYDRRRRRDRYDDYDRRRRRRSRTRSRSRSRDRGLGSPQGHRFRFRDLSRERPEKNEEDLEAHNVELEAREVAYVFGRQGSTKDKLARVSGTHIELNGSNLIIKGRPDGVDRAKRYVTMLLAQRNGAVLIKTEEFENDLTLVDVPSDCKGFVTGKHGGTLRQIEKECATLMTFCKIQDDEDGKSKEPLAIFGTRRGRLTAELKVMSVVEGKHSGWFVNDDEDNEPPDIKIQEGDDDGDWGVDFMKLEKETLGYALGQGGNTRQKLQIASGCIIQYIGYWAAFGGTREEQKRGKTYLQWLINQRKQDFDVDIRDRNDVTILYVPEPSVGYVTGRKAATLRNLEAQSGTFCFFDKRNSGRKKEKMLIFASNAEQRKLAVKEVETIVEYHQNKNGYSGKVRVGSLTGDSNSSSRGRSRSRSSQSRSQRSRSRSRSPKSRTPSPPKKENSEAGTSPTKEEPTSEMKDD